MKEDPTMSQPQGTPGHLAGRALTAVAAMALVGAAGCTGVGSGDERFVGPAIIEIRLPAAMGSLRRPAVEFDHAEHSKALEEDCTACHLVDDELGLIAKLNRRADGSDGDELMELYHRECIGCHQERDDAGPVTCGECHVRRPAALSLRAPMSWDYSLHRRHVAGLADREADSCEHCHHVLDETTDVREGMGRGPGSRSGVGEAKLEYRAGTEEACASCHGEADDGDTLSLRNAAHRDCINCHRRRAADKLETGPTTCMGCHDDKAQAEYERIDAPPRLLRAEPGRQPNQTWIATPDGKSNLVAFDHAAHEARAPFCTSCHHDSLAACKDCHSLTGKSEGDGITVAQAYHRVSSQHSCVGCHAARTAEPECAGCHSLLTPPPGDAACARCHNGPPAGTATADLPAAPAAAVATPLPQTSDDFPENLTIDVLVADYAASEFPHQQMVAALFEHVSASPLATRFHGTTEALCSGCHHQSPIGARPPPCRSCHADTAEPGNDKPGLRAAYHRQCIGCHQQMGIKEVGCVDCHAVANKEGN